MREFTSICSGPKLRPTANNSLVFHTNFAVDSGFAGMAMPVTICGGSGSKFLPLYTSILCLVRVSQKFKFTNLQDQIQ
jgi:hypothetical protein